MPFVSRKTAWGIGLLALAGALLAAGFRLDGLPFQPGALFSDSSTSHYPAALFLRESVLGRGEFPLWREAFMAGAPFTANPLNKTAYPLQWLGLLLEPLTLLNGLVLAHFIIAGAGMWLWARSLGISASGALMSALAYMLAPRILAHLGAGHLDLLYAAAWWPWLMWAAGRQGPRGWRWSLLTGLFAGLVLLADVRLALYALPCAALAFAIRWQQGGRSWKVLALGGLSVVLAFGLAASVLVPVAAWSPWMTRAALAPAETGAGLLSAGGLAGLIVPAASASGQETLTYLGIVTLLLAAIGAVSLPRRWRGALAVAVLAVVLLALGSNGPVWPLLANGGLLAWFRMPARIWFVLALLAAPLAGRGVDRLIAAVPGVAEQSSRARRLRLAAFGLLAVTLALGAGLLTAPAARLGGAQILLAGGGLGAALLLALAGRLRGRRLYGVLLLLLIADGLFSAHAWIEWRPADDWLGPYQPVIAALRADEAARVYSPSYSLPQEAAAQAGLRLFGGVDPFQISGVSAAIVRAGGITFRGYSIVMPPLAEADDWRESNRDAPLDPALLAEWGVSHVVAAFPIDQPDLRLLAQIGGAWIYRNALYRPLPAPDAPPDFADGWPDLPGQADVARLNGLTLEVWVGSMMLLLIVSGLLAGAALSRRTGERP